MDLARTLLKAIERRKPLTSVTNAMRLVNGKGDSLEGLLIDRYHQHLQIQILSDQWRKQQEAIVGILEAALPVEYLIIKSRRGLDMKHEVLKGSLSTTVVEEYGIKFEVDLNDGLNCGLFLDMRQNRRMVGLAAKGKKVFNGFSYTCSFGVHARRGGAIEVINTDISRKVLERGENNYELNGLTVAKGEFVRTDSMTFVQRAFKKGNGFDMVILDPPSFARYEAKVFQVKRDLPKLIALGVAVLNPGGRMLVSTNYSEISHADLERILAKGLNGRQVKHLERIGQDVDFPGTNTFKESYLAGLWVKFL
jgi:23S rRNA (cytosine1962-C5)-methyltransferase